MRALRYIVVIAAVAIAGVAAHTGATYAAPSNSPRSEIITIHCGDAGSFDLVVMLNDGEWSPGHDSASNSLFIPNSFREVGTFTAADGTVYPIDEYAAKPGPKNNAPMLTCTFHLEFSGPDGHAVIDGTVTGFQTPAR
jgi:hypothetical protein